MEQEEKELRKTKIYKFIKGNLLNGIVFLTSFAYLFYNMITIQRTELTIVEAIVKTGISIIIGFLIKQLLSENGFIKGYSSTIWISNFEKYNEACNIANNHIEKVENFYLSEEIEKKKKYRRNNLAQVRLKYDEYFDYKGNYIPHTIISPKQAKKGQIEGATVLTRYQRYILKKCIKVKIYNLNLFSEYGNEIENDTRKERTDSDQRKYMLGKNSIASLLTAIAGVYFTAMWNNWNWGAFITSTIQVCIWVACGIGQLYKNYNYVVIDKVNKLTRKKELIIKFARGCDEGKYTTDPYELLEKEHKENGQKEVLDTNADISNK